MVSEKTIRLIYQTEAFILNVTKYKGINSPQDIFKNENPLLIKCCSPVEGAAIGNDLTILDKPEDNRHHRSVFTFDNAPQVSEILDAAVILAARNNNSYGLKQLLDKNRKYTSMGDKPYEPSKEVLEAAKGAIKILEYQYMKREDAACSKMLEDAAKDARPHAVIAKEREAAKAAQNPAMQQAEEVKKALENPLTKEGPEKEKKKKKSWLTIGKKRGQQANKNNERGVTLR